MVDQTRSRLTHQNLWQRWKEDGDSDARKLLIEHYLPLVDIAAIDGWCHFFSRDIAEEPEEQYGMIRSLLERNRLTPIAFNAGILETDLTRELEKWKALVDLAAKLGIKVVTLPASKEEIPLHTQIDRLRPMVEIAASRGVFLTVETHVGTVTEKPENALKLVRAIEGLGLTLDISHYYCNGYEDQVEQLMPYVKHVHIRDCGRTWDNIQMEYGTGILELSRWLLLLKQHQYGGAITVEYIDRFAEGYDIMESVLRCVKDCKEMWEGLER